MNETNPITDDLVHLPELSSAVQSLTINYLNQLSERPVGWIAPPLKNLARRREASHLYAIASV